jgi:hypothetical protein
MLLGPMLAALLLPGAAAALRYECNGAWLTGLPLLGGTLECNTPAMPLDR